jgi:outer membrane protein OmpA-like peptidoglycan-associated protein
VKLRANLSAPFLAALCASACATVVAPRGATQRIASDPPGATVLDSAGRVLGTTPLRATLRTRERQRFSLFAPGFDTAEVVVGRRVREVLISLLNPFAWPVDGLSGAWWEHDPGRVSVRLRTATSVTPPPAEADTTRLDDHEAAVVFAAFAAGAARAGCEPLLVDAWRDAALALDPQGAASPQAELRALADEEVAKSDSTLRRLCARPGPLVERLRQIRTGEAAATPAPGTANLFGPVYFGFGAWEVRDDSVRARLRALGRHLAASPMPVRLRVEGHADPAGRAARNDTIALLRAQAVIAELLRGGAPASCCAAISHGAAPETLAVAGASGSAPGARLNRRVTFSLDFREAP